MRARLQDVEHGVVGLAGVDDDGQVSGEGEFEVLAKDGFGDGPGGEVPVEVEPGLAYSDHLGLPGQFAQPMEVGGLDRGRFVRVDADRGVDPGVAAGEGEGGFARGEVGPHGDDGEDTRGLGALEAGVQVRGKAAVIQVGVGVDEARAWGGVRRHA